MHLHRRYAREWSHVDYYTDGDMRVFEVASWTLEVSPRGWLKLVAIAFVAVGSTWAVAAGDEIECQVLRKARAGMAGLQGCQWESPTCPDWADDRSGSQEVRPFHHREGSHGPYALDD